MIFRLPHQKDKALSYIERNNKELICDIHKDKRTRSVVQNNYYWLLLTMIEQDTGNDKDELHEYFKKKYLNANFTLSILRVDDSLTYAKSTTKLTTTEFEYYLERIRMFASRELGIFLPLPGETEHDYLQLK